MRIECVDSMAWLARCAPARFELVFLDPPFDSGLLPTALALVAPLLVEGGWAYLESGDELPSPPASYECHRQGRAGAVHHALWRHGYTRAVD